MKRFILIILFILIIPLLHIPKYIELNNLIIIDKIKVTCKNKIYIEIREIKPLKEDNGIIYKYKYYKTNSNSLNNFKTAFENKNHKNFYYNKTKYLETNCNDTNQIKEQLNINPKIIKN